MKFLLEAILVVIVIFFTWNILKRMFLKTFYPQIFSQNKRTNVSQKPKQTKEKEMENLHWDAETVDYEEVKEKPNGGSTS